MCGLFLETSEIFGVVGIAGLKGSVGLVLMRLKGFACSSGRDIVKTRSD